MYYLRTMAASAPIQFTVDQEQLKVVDTNVARTNGAKKRVGPSAGYNSNSHSAVPRPMYQRKPSEPSMDPNGMPTPSATPPPEDKKLTPPSKKVSTVLPTFKADADEGDSPKVLAAEPVEPLTKEELPESAVKQEEDTENSEAREGDIYAQKVLQCKLLVGEGADP